MISLPQEQQNKTVLISLNRKNKTSFPVFNGWYDCENIYFPSFRWLNFRSDSHIPQSSIVFTSLFCFAKASLWIKDVPADYFLPPISPLISDFLYTCRLLNANWNVKISNIPVAKLVKRSSSNPSNDGINRVLQWFSIPNFLDNVAKISGINVSDMEAQWKAHIGVINLNDEDEIMYKYGSLLNAEKMLSLIRANLMQQYKKEEKKKRKGIRNVD
jgi:hypothetical protein